VRNRFLTIQSAVITQNMILQYAKDAAPHRAFKTVHIDTAKAAEAAWAKYDAGDTSADATRPLLFRTSFGLGLGFAEKTDNEVLGLVEMSDKEVKELVAKYV
jgi:hypothetical protein